MKHIIDYVSQSEKLLSKDKYVKNDESLSLERFCRSHIYATSGYYTDLIREGSGLFKGITELSAVCASVIDENFDKVYQSMKFSITANEFSQIDHNNFFNLITITVTKSKKKYKNFKGDASYDSKEHNELWNDFDKKFSLININVELPEDAYEHTKSCADLIEHELEHAWQDKCYREKINSSLVLKRNELEKYGRKIGLNDDEIEVLKDFGNRDEANSYIAQIDGELGKQKFDTYSNCIEWLDDNSGTWKSYKKLREVSKNMQPKLKREFDKAWSKFINHLGFVIYDHTIETKISHRSYRNFSEQLINRINVNNIARNIIVEFL